MRTYLTVVDDTPEAEVALRFAARRAAKTGGAIAILALIEPAEVMPWGGVQATIEEEAREHADKLVLRAAGTLITEAGLSPAITVRQGDGPRILTEMIAADPSIAALVLGAAASGAPGPLVAHFAGADAGRLRVPIMIIPGCLTPGQIDALS